MTADHPIIIAGGGIGGLAAACALARKGFAVRLLEQAQEFGEIGAGIQLGPNAFRALAKLGLKDRVLADAHVPPAQEMRDALTGALITQVPLGAEYFGRFGQPYALTHRADLHAAYLQACQGNNLVALETNRRVVDHTGDGDGVSVQLAWRGDQGPRADRLRRYVVAGARQDRRRRQAARLRPRRVSTLLGDAATRCCSISRKAPAWRPRMRSASPRRRGRRRTSSRRIPCLPGATRTGQVQIMARVYGEFYQARGVAAELRNRMLAARTPQDAYDGLAWLYGGE